MSLLRFSVLLSLFVLAGCATPRAECRSHGGTEWREVETAHFRIRTDLDSTAARNAAVELERFRRALLVSFGTDFDPPGKLPVTLLRSIYELREFAGKDVGGYWVRVGAQPRIVMAGDSGSLGGAAIPEIVRHELAHSVLAHVLLRQPRWLAEGMAEYLQMVHVRADGTVDVGRSNPDAVANANRRGHYSLTELWAWDREVPSHDALPNYYASSWVWVSYFMNEHPEAFANFLGRLARAEEPRAAWDAAFQGADPRAMDPLVRKYLKTGRAAVLNLPLPEVNVVMAERPVSEAEVHVVRAELHRVGGAHTPEEHRKGLQGELAQALLLEPGNVSATLLQSALEGDDKEQVPVLRALVAAHPGSGEAWRELGQALVSAHASGDEARAALVRATKLMPDDAEALNSLAWHDVTSGRAKEALAPATRAVKLAPWDAAVLDTYAAVVSELGRCAEALQVQQRALDVLPDGADAEDRAPYLRRLSEYQQKCGAPAPLPLGEGKGEGTVSPRTSRP